MHTNSIVVISDLHVGSGPLDDCDEELESNLVSFINQLCSKVTAVELVINGDFLDFAQAAPWAGSELESESPDGVPLCFTEEQSIAKLEAITREHKPIFKALGDFLTFNPYNHVVILPGNHDADFFWPRVRALFMDAVCGRSAGAGERLRFHLEQAYRPPQYPTVWIEHGNQHDPLNSFYVDENNFSNGTHKNGTLYWSQQKPPVFLDLKGRPRLYECIGTRFMIKFMNKLDANYPFVDNIKPFSKFLNLFVSSAVAGGYGPLKVTLTVFGMLRYLGSSMVSHREDVLSFEKERSNDLSDHLSGVFKRLSRDQHKLFVENLSERGLGFKIDRPLFMCLQDAALRDELLAFLAENVDLLDDLPQLDESLLGTHCEAVFLSLAKGLNMDETAKLTNVARKVLGHNSLEGVVMGHTHEKVNDFSNLKYFNTGSWTRYYNFESQKLTSWSILQTNSYQVFPYQLNYVEIVPGKIEPVGMKTYMEKGGDADGRA